MRKLLVGPDIHFPFHDRKALGCFLGAFDVLQPDGVLLLGDVLDCERFSRHGRKTALERADSYIADEIEPANRMFNYIQKRSDNLIMLEGNHEFRVHKRLYESGMEDLIPLVDPRKLLGEGRKNFTYVPYVQKPTTPLPHYRITKDLIAVHGWSYAKHAEATHLDLAKGFSVYNGDTHRQQVFTSRCPITDRTIKAVSPGCLSRKQPIWLHSQPAQWTQGFALIYIDGDCWTDYLITIMNGECVLPDGKMVSYKKNVKLIKNIEEGY